MKLNNLNNFILESLFNNLILESKLIYMDNFTSLLNRIMDDSDDNDIKMIAKFLLYIVNKDMKLVQNYIDLGIDNDKISFIPDNKVKENNIFYKVYADLNGNIPYLCNRNHQIVDQLEIPKEGLNRPLSLSEMPSNKWQLIFRKSGKDFGFNNLTFYYLKNIDDPNYYIIGLDSTSYITKGVSPIIEFTGTKGEIKIGRFINKILDTWFKENPDDKEQGNKKDFTPSKIEKFVNYYTSKLLFERNLFNSFKIVSGEDIRNSYLEDNYFNKKGQLGNSCMRYSECQKFLDIYVKNPKVCSLLILEEDSKISGRAILWTDINGNKFIDRIYTNKDNYKNIFKKWAELNNYKEIYDTDTICIVEINSELKYDYYPYMDTLNYLKELDGKCFLFNYSAITKFKRPYYSLQETDGSGYECL